MAILRDCQLCPRLTDYRREQQRRYPDYHCRPVAASGPADARLLIVGLAPGLHGANASGIPFSGDASGEFLFNSLHRFGFASHPAAPRSDNRTRLVDCRITNAVKCLPPANRPTTFEIETCNRYLREEIAQLPARAVVLALGRIAHRAILLAFEQVQARFPFAHLGEHALTGHIRLIDSYHCSRYNVNTGRLDAIRFDAVFSRIREILT